MKYIIRINDTSPGYSDMRNPSIDLGTIEVIGDRSLAQSVYDAILEKYPSRDVEVVMYVTTQQSAVVAERLRN